MQMNRTQQDAKCMHICVYFELLHEVGAFHESTSEPDMIALPLKMAQGVFLFHGNLSFMAV